MSFSHHCQTAPLAVIRYLYMQNFNQPNPNRETLVPSDVQLTMPAAADVQAGADMSGHVPTGADMFGQWLTVQEVVAYCQWKGLPRTQKTVRRWASRAADSPNGAGELTAQRQDTENGFRWMIERNSLDIKIEQERDFEMHAQLESEDANMSGHVPTGADMSGHVPVEEMRTDEARTHADTSEHVRTGADTPSDEMVEFLKKQLDRANQQLDVKDRQIDSLLERDRETNILIQGLQTSLTGMVQALPSGRKDARDTVHDHGAYRGDNSPTAQSSDAL